MLALGNRYGCTLTLSANHGHTRFDRTLAYGHEEMDFREPLLGHDLDDRGEESGAGVGGGRGLWGAHD